MDQPIAAATTALYQGFIDELSKHHAAGWVWNIADPAERVEYEIVLPTAQGERVLLRGCADTHTAVLVMLNVGDGGHAFYVMLPDGVTEAERAAIYMRTKVTGHRLDVSPRLKTVFEPISHIAADIVDNCNLRCPFCVYDYTGVKATNFMTDDTFESALRLIPFVSDGNFWLSCLHEATLHPKLVEFIQRVPRQYRSKIFYTTNLAKRMPLSYFEFLSHSGVHHLNISVESLVPDVYERMRKGARFPIFLENWRVMLEAFQAGSAAPRLRYIIMAYRSNVREIPALVEQLRREKMAWQVEIRHTFYMPHIPAEFRDSEFMSTEEWAWLAAELAHYSADDVMLMQPPGGIGHNVEVAEPAPAVNEIQRVDAAPARPQKASMVTVPGGPGTRIPRPLSVRIEWDGTLNIYGEEPLRPGEQPKLANFLYTNVNYIHEPVRFLSAL